MNFHRKSMNYTQDFPAMVANLRCTECTPKFYASLLYTLLFMRDLGGGTVMGVHADEDVAPEQVPDREVPVAEARGEHLHLRADGQRLHVQPGLVEQSVRRELHLQAYAGLLMLRGHLEYLRNSDIA